jgi:hypothetical protein
LNPVSVEEKEDIIYSLKNNEVDTNLPAANTESPRNEKNG